MDVIQSRQNQWIKRARKAIERHEDEIVIEGPKMIGDALAKGWKPIVILQEEGRKAFGEEAQHVEKKLFRELSETSSTQGVIAIFPRPVITLGEIMSYSMSRVVALDGIQDPGNVGTIIRSAAAFDIGGVVCLHGSADPWSPKAIRASAGAILSIPVTTSSATDFVDACAQRGIELFAATASGASTRLPTQRFAIVFGSEGQGVSEEIESTATGLRIPMSSRVESLNVAAAAAILLSRSWERVRSEE